MPQTPAPKPQSVPAGPPLLIHITWKGEDHDPQFTDYGEELRSIFVSWAPAVETCGKSVPMGKGAFDLALVIDASGNILDAALMDTHLAEPSLDSFDPGFAAFARCVVNLARADESQFPSTPGGVELLVRYPYLVR